MILDFVRQIKVSIKHYNINHFVLNILCMTQFVTSSIAVLQAFLCDKLSVYDQVVIKNLKRRRYGFQTNVYTNFHLKGNLRMEFTV